MKNHMKAANIEVVQRLARKHDYDRYLCSVFAPSRIRAHLWTLLAFNYEIGRVYEQVSEPMLGEIRLQWWRDAIDEIYEGNPRKHEVVLPLSSLVTECTIPKTLFIEMINARALDLDDGGPTNQKALETYALSTGGALSEAGLRLASAAPQPQQVATARHSGAAWALTGLLRAVGYHASMNKVFIPQHALDAANIRRDDIYRGDFTPALCSVLKDIGKAARNYCQSARKQSVALERKQRFAFLPSIIAADYLDRMEKAAFDLREVDFEKGRLSRLYDISKAYFFNRS